MGMRLVFGSSILAALHLISCSGSRSAEDVLFHRIPASQSGVSFKNAVRENDSLNILSYEYLYNGGGVAVIDVNNDGLADLFFTGNQVPNALYLNEGNLRFHDITERAGVALPEDWCTGVSVVDVNADGLDDIYVCVGGPGNRSVFPNKLFINQGNLTFREVAEEYGLADPGESIQALFFDYDKDGDLDMYLLTGGGFERSAIVARPILAQGENRNTDRLYRNTYDSALGHPVFEDVSLQAGIRIEGFGLGVSMLDANQDSWPDVFVSNDYLSRDLLYVNNGDGTFTDKSLTYFKHTSHFSMGNDVGDINNDGLPDIVTVDMLPQDHARRKLMFGPDDHDRFYMAVNHGYGYQYMRNMLQVGHGRNGFIEVGQLAGIDRTDWSWAPLLADFDNDGRQDLFITNGFGKDITDLDFVKFRESVKGSAFGDKEKQDKIFSDSLRTRPPVVVPNYLYRNERDFYFSDRSQEWGIDQPSLSNGAAYVDLDNDGDLELVVNNIDQEAFIYQNLSVEKRRNVAGYVRIILDGAPDNSVGLGSTVCIYTEGKKQCRFQQVVRGFQSSVDKVIHFGIGDAAQIDSLTVIWPDARESSALNVARNQTTKLDYRHAAHQQVRPLVKPDAGFFAAAKAISFKHHEPESNDFRTQPLLLHGFSSQGPCIATNDVNGDGLDDVFIGGSYQLPATLFIQGPDGSFARTTLPTEMFEDLGAVFFDADGDGDLDLYVCSGGSERYAEHLSYQDRLYLNNGKGQFSHSPGSLPQMTASTACVAAGDFDHDGDQDLFVGGRVVPGKYPETPRSYLLENRNGTFVDVTHELNPALKYVGLVTSALWTDLNNDSFLDLVVAGEFMEITLFRNDKGTRLVNITGETALKNVTGMWNSLLAADFDNDGDMDFVAGNIGRNTPYRISDQNPLDLFYADFDQNGSVDPIFSSRENGVSFPVPSLDQLAKQLPQVKKHIRYYSQYARVTTPDLLGLFKTPYKKISCNAGESMFIENLGNDKFAMKPLPLPAQLSSVNGMISEDINRDGLPDLIIIGNSYDQEVVQGRYDAGTGLILLNTGNNQFESVPPGQTSFFATGDGRSLVRVDTSPVTSLLLVAQNNDSLLVYRMAGLDGLPRFTVKETETNAIVYLGDSTRRKVEFHAGTGYRAQSSRSIILTKGIRAVQTFDSKGNKVRFKEISPEGSSPMLSHHTKGKQ